LPFGNKVIHNSYRWTFVVRDSGEHYRLLVVLLSREQLWCPRKRDRDEFLKVLDWDS
jgi:hypothetical protein